MLREKWGAVKSQAGAAYQLSGLLLLFFLVFKAGLAHEAQAEDVGCGPGQDK